jgi:hypothetical protein
MTALLTFASLLGAWIVYIVWKHEAPLWFCAVIGAISGLAYGLLMVDFFGAGL